MTDWLSEHLWAVWLSLAFVLAVAGEGSDQLTDPGPVGGGNGGSVFGSGLSATAEPAPQESAEPEPREAG